MFAYVEKGVVKEVCRNESPFNIFFPDYAAKFIECPDDVEHGDTFDGDIWEKPLIASVVNEQLTPRQIRMALTRSGLRETVEAAVKAGSQDLKDWWEFSTVFERNHPQVLAMAQALNVENALLDELWILGAEL